MFEKQEEGQRYRSIEDKGSYVVRGLRGGWGHIMLGHGCQVKMYKFELPI